MMGKLVGHEPVISFVTLGELTQWVTKRDWGPHRRAQLLRWLDSVGVVHTTDRIAQTWGELVTFAERRGRSMPVNDSWIARVASRTGYLWRLTTSKDYVDVVEHEGLVLI
jgi:predicted nucleic acid-binding protein